MEASEIRGPTYTRNSECRFPSKMSRCSLPHDKGLVGLFGRAKELVVKSVLCPVTHMKTIKQYFQVVLFDFNSENV